MQDIATKVEGSQLTAEEFNQIPSEIENVITSTGQTLTNTDVRQLVKAIAIYVGLGNFYNVSGSANNLELSPLDKIQSVLSYRQGLEVRFIPSLANTGLVSINISGLNSVNLVDDAGNNLTAGRLIPGAVHIATYDSGKFKLTGVVDASLVHKTGNEIISGFKTFTGGIESKKNGVGFTIKNPNLTFGEVPSAECYNSITFSDKSGNTAGILDHANAISGNDYNRWLLRYSVDGVTKQTGIENLKTASDNKTTLKFTTDYVNAQTPYYLSNIRFRNLNSSFASGKTGQNYISFHTGDTSNSQTGFINSYLNATSTSTNISATYPKNDGTVNYYTNGLTIYCGPEGTGNVQLSNSLIPITGDNSNKVPTTSWVNNAGAVVTAKSFSANGYVKYSSGLIIQWGSVGRGVTDITFPTAFSNENAIVCPVAYYNSASQIAYYDLTTTGCKIYPNRSDYSVRWFAIGY